MDNDKLLGLLYLVGILIVWQLGRRVYCWWETRGLRRRHAVVPVAIGTDEGTPYVPPPVVSIHAYVDLSRPPGCCPLCGRDWPLPGPAAEVYNNSTGILAGLRKSEPSQAGVQGPPQGAAAAEQPPSPPDPGSRHQK
jgi:hypothetical protein